MTTALIVDDEKNIRSTLARSLRLEGFAALEAENGSEALELLEGGEVDLVVLDLEMPVMGGLEMLEKMAEKGIRVPAIVLTAHGSIEKAVRAVRLGAFDFIEKPPTVERILVAATNALRYGRLEEENLRLAAEAGLGDGILGSSAAMQALSETIRRVAPTAAGVLLLGENGSGKELVARAIHAASPRRDRPLVTVNCAAIPETLFESELFGHARGAFTGATEARRGKFQQADGGTLFLDEIGETPLPLQPKMLRALESGEVERVGGRSLERVNVRVVAATNRDLEAEVRAGRFREDLYYRLLVVPVRVPPLRERAEDIPLLARSLLDAACRRNRIRPKRLSGEALRALERHDWPGNVRELRNALERIAILVPSDVVLKEHLDFLRAPAGGIRGDQRQAGGPAAPGPDGRIERALPAALRSPHGRGLAEIEPPEDSPTRGGEGHAHEPASRGDPAFRGDAAFRDPASRGDPTAGARGQAPAGAFDLASEVQRYERAVILRVLERNHWHMTRAAQELSVERSHLYKKLKALGIERPGSEHQEPEPGGDRQKPEPNGEG